MTDRDKKGSAIITNAGTDTETGNEGLSDKENKEKEMRALKAMFDRGLMTKDEYQNRLKEMT